MTRGELGTLLLEDTTRLGEPVLLALGRGRILAPVRVADVGPWHVTTSTGLLYNQWGMSASRSEYRSIRSMAYETVKRPSDMLGAGN